jgi:hypothetical protein
LLALAAACSDDGEVERGEDGRVLEASDVSVYDLAAGDCLQPPERVDDEVGTVRVVPCEEPHTQEVFALLEYEGEDGEEAGERASFPGDEAVAAFAEARCLTPFRDYFGVDYLDSSLFLTYLVPTVRSWDEERDREVVCVAQTTGEQLTESLRDSGR